VWVDGPAAGGPRAPVEVDQVGTRFVPGALVVPVGTEVVFWNSGPELHDVYGIQGADRFDVGTYEPGSARRRVFDQAGPVQIGCNKHEWMHLDLLVTPNPWFASVDHGRFRVDGVPAGERTVAVWGPRVRGESTATVTVPAGGEVEARMALPR
jgi:plastocyanin